MNHTLKDFNEIFTDIINDTDDYKNSDFKVLVNSMFKDFKVDDYEEHIYKFVTTPENKNIKVSKNLLETYKVVKEELINKGLVSSSLIATKKKSLDDDAYILDEKFTDKQKKAIFNDNGNTVVLAGAGSGKTTVFTERIKRIISEGIGEEEILALTFTEKASWEMKKRTDIDLNYFGTFHSVFLKLLRNMDEAYYSYSIMDESSYNYYLTRTLNKLDFDTKEFLNKIGTAVDLDKLINGYMEECLLKAEGLNEFYDLLNDKIEEKTQFTDGNIVKKFFEYKREDNKMSFSDILVYTYFVLKDEDNRQKL